jgi:hypothetical protein
MAVAEQIEDHIAASPEIQRSAGRSERKLRVAMLVPDGVGIRNFVLGPFLTMAERQAEIHIFHLVEDAVLPEYSAGHEASQWRRLPGLQETPLLYLLRNTLADAHRYWMDNGPAWMDLKRPIRGSWRTRMAREAARWLARMAASPERMMFLDRVQVAAMSSAPETAHFRKIFGKIRPDVVFCTHQRPTQVVAPVLAAQEMGIPTATFIFTGGVESLLSGDRP